VGDACVQTDADNRWVAVVRCIRVAAQHTTEYEKSRYIAVVISTHISIHVSLSLSLPLFEYKVKSEINYN